MVNKVSKYKKFLGAVAGLGIIAVALGGPPPFAGKPNELSFQEGVNGYVGIHDSYIRPDHPNSNFGSEGAAAQVAASTNRLKVLIRFTNIIGTGINQIPPDAEIISARLEMYSHEVIPPGGIAGPAEQVVGAYGLLQQFNEDEVTWIHRITGIEWNSFGAEASSNVPIFDSSFDREATTQEEVVVDKPGFYSWNVKKSLQEQLDAGKEYGWALISIENDEDFSRWITSENPDFRLRPKLIVKYKRALPKP